VHVKEPTKILGDKNVNSNLRYKQVKHLNTSQGVFEIKNPADAFYRTTSKHTFVFAREDRFFAYRII